MVNTVVAFDIDGTLTEPKVRDKFKQLNQSDDTVVGIITSNPPFAAHNFIKKHSLEPEFTHSAIFKARPMLGISMSYITEEKKYVGNTITDKISSNLSRWEFENASEI